MRNVIEMLRLEHEAMENHSRNLTPENSEEIFASTLDFLFNVHMTVEEEVLFPAIEREVHMGDEIMEGVRKISHEHRLLRNVSAKLTALIPDDRDQFYKRLPVFFNTLVRHNREEEELLFNAGEVSGMPESYSSDAAVWKIVRKYGVTKYQLYTGTSDSFLASRLRLSIPFIK